MLVTRLSRPYVASWRSATAPSTSFIPPRVRMCPQAHHRSDRREHVFAYAAPSRLILQRLLDLTE